MKFFTIILLKKSKKDQTIKLNIFFILIFTKLRLVIFFDVIMISLLGQLVIHYSFLLIGNGTMEEFFIF